MNKLSLAKRVQLLSMLCEGSSMRSISRVVDVSINTVTKALIRAGEACIDLHEEMVRDVKASRIQCEEIWSFCYAKEKNVATAEAADYGAGDVWTWTARDADTKLIVSYFVGDRSSQSAIALTDDLRSRLSSCVQLIREGHESYLEWIEDEFGRDMDSALRASYVEPRHLDTRMGMRRFTRFTNAFSKKLENHCHMLALYFAFYNFVRIDKTLKVTPAMAASVTDRRWTMEDITARIDAGVVAPKRDSYNKPNG